MTDPKKPDEKGGPSTGETPPDGVLTPTPRRRSAAAGDTKERPFRRSLSVRGTGVPRRRSGALGVVLVLLVAVAAGSWWLAHRGGDEGALPVDFSGGGSALVEDMAVGGDRAVVLVFPEWDAGGYVTEQRQIPSRDRPGEDLFGLITVLCEGPRISGAVSALPAGTRALAAFVNPDDRSVVLDFSSELVTGHPGGSAAEVATLTSILRTVALNFPGTRRCVILVEGAQIETLAGHLDLVRGFDPRRWL